VPSALNVRRGQVPSVLNVRRGQVPSVLNVRRGQVPSVLHLRSTTRFMLLSRRLEVPIYMAILVGKNRV